jgi:integral membrane protein
VAVESSSGAAVGRNPAALPVKTAKALQRYRIAAFVVGVGLLILVLAMVLRYAADMRWATAVWGPIHGVLYAAYVLLAFDLGYRERWSFKGIIGVLLAGVVPILSFVVEKIVHRKVLARERL